MAERLNDELLERYVEAVGECSAAAVKRVCARINSGQAGLNTNFPPTPADIAQRAAAIDDARQPGPELHNGLIDMDWGHGRVDLRGLTTEEQDAIRRCHGVAPDGTNFALLDLEGKRAKLAELPKLAPPRKAEAVEGRKPWLESTGWVEWSPDMGDFPPIDPFAMVWLKFVDGTIESTPQLASDMDWKHQGGIDPADIVAYKVLRVTEAMTATRIQRMTGEG